MSDRISLSEVGGVTVVRFVDSRVLDEALIQEIGAELFRLVEIQEKAKILVSFQNVEYLSNALLGKLITLDKKVKAREFSLKLASICPELYEVFTITKLDKLFDIKGSEAEALAAFG